MTGQLSNLGRRERQIVEILFRRGAATVADVRAELPDAPSYSAVRGMLRLLEEKGYCAHEWDGPRHVYMPTADVSAAGRSAARNLLHTFFRGSMESAVAAMLGASDQPLSDAELDRLTRLIEDARGRARGGGA